MSPRAKLGLASTIQQQQQQQQPQFQQHMIDEPTLQSRKGVDYNNGNNGQPIDFRVQHQHQLEADIGRLSGENQFLNELLIKAKIDREDLLKTLERQQELAIEKEAKFLEVEKVRAATLENFKTALSKERRKFDKKSAILQYSIEDLNEILVDWAKIGTQICVEHPKIPVKELLENTCLSIPEAKSQSLKIYRQYINALRNNNDVEQENNSLDIFSNTSQSRSNFEGLFDVKEEQRVGTASSTLSDAGQYLRSILTPGNPGATNLRDLISREGSANPGSAAGLRFGSNFMAADGVSVNFPPGSAGFGGDYFGGRLNSGARTGSSHAGASSRGSNKSKPDSIKGKAVGNNMGNADKVDDNMHVVNSKNNEIEQQTDEEREMLDILMSYANENDSNSNNTKVGS